MVLEFDAYGTVVAAHYFGVDGGVFDFWSDGATGEPVVDAPPDVAGAGVRPVRPPGVGASLVGVRGAECIDEAGVEKVLKSLAFFDGEAVLANIWFGVGEVDFSMCDVHVTTVEYGFGLLELLEIREYRVIPFVIAQHEAREVGFAVWCVARYNPVVVKFGSDDATLGIWIAVVIPRQLEMLDDVRREAVEVAKWLDFAKNRRA